MNRIFLCLFLAFLAHGPLLAQTTTVVLRTENAGSVSSYLATRLEELGATDVRTMNSPSYLILSFRGMNNQEQVQSLLAGGGTTEFRFQEDDGTSKVALTSADLKSAVPTLRFQQWSIEVETTEAGKEKLRLATEKRVGQKLSIYVNGNEISSPVVQEAIAGGKVLITGNFTEQEVRGMADSLNTRFELLEMTQADR